jgi:hypothetical protein
MGATRIAPLTLPPRSGGEGRPASLARRAGVGLSLDALSSWKQPPTPPRTRCARGGGEVATPPVFA